MVGLHPLVLLLLEDDTLVPKHVGVLIIIIITNCTLLSPPQRLPPSPMSVQQNELAYQ